MMVGGQLVPLKAKTLHAFGGDEIARVVPCPGARLVFVWVTLSEQKWVILRERRRTKR
jgi:hypothetical protein